MKRRKRILMLFQHPTWVRQFEHILRVLEGKGYEVKNLAIDKDATLELLKNYSIRFQKIANSTGKGRLEKAWLVIWLSIKIFFISLRFKPDIYIGRASPMFALNSFIFRKPHIVFEDTERSVEALKACQLLSTMIMTPSSFKTDLGPKQMRLETYKELFYLHPNDFKPNRANLRKKGIKDGEKYIFIRFVAWNASHDIGQNGFTLEEKWKLITELEKYAKVLISSEIKLPKKFNKYLLDKPFENFLDVLAFAEFVIAEGGVVSEAVLLGTHSIFVSDVTAGTFDEQSKAGLLYQINEQEGSLEMTLDISKQLLNTPNLREIGIEKRNKLLETKVSINGYYLEKVEEYLNKSKSIQFKELFVKGLLRYLFGGALLFIGIKYLAGRQDWELIWNLELKEIAFLLIISILIHVISGVQYAYVFKKTSQVKLKLYDLIGLPFGMGLSGYLFPFQGSLVFSTLILKLKYMAKIHQAFSITFFNYTYSLMVAGVILLYYSLVIRNSYLAIENLLFIVLAINPLLLRFVDKILERINIPKLKKLHELVHNVVKGILGVFRRPSDLAVIVLINTTHIALMSCWFWLISQFLNMNPPFISMIVFTALIRLTLVLKFTPGNLGIQELLSSGIFALLGLGASNGLILMITARLIAFVNVALLGSVYILTNLKYFNLKMIDLQKRSHRDEREGRIKLFYNMDFE